LSYQSRRPICWAVSPATGRRGSAPGESAPRQGGSRKGRGSRGALDRQQAWSFRLTMLVRLGAGRLRSDRPVRARRERRASWRQATRSHGVTASAWQPQKPVSPGLEWGCTHRRSRRDWSISGSVESVQIKSGTGGSCGWRPGTGGRATKPFGPWTSCELGAARSKEMIQGSVQGTAQASAPLWGIGTGLGIGTLRAERPDTGVKHGYWPEPHMA
jgi:hypothetical protein